MYMYNKHNHSVYRQYRLGIEIKLHVNILISLFIVGKSSNFATVPARLILEGKDHGIQMFIVQLRDRKTHQPMPGRWYIIKCILNWPLPILNFQGHWIMIDKTTVRRERQTATVKNSKWVVANQSAIYKCNWEVEPGTSRIKFNHWSWTWDVRV